MKVTLEASFASASRAAETLLHEIMHGVYWAYGIDDKDDEERVVSTMAAGLQQVWRDNPELMAWITEAVADG